MYSTGREQHHTRTESYNRRDFADQEKTLSTRKESTSGASQSAYGYHDAPDNSIVRGLGNKYERVSRPETNPNPNPVPAVC